MANHMDCSNNCNALPQSGIYPPPIPTHMFSPTVPCYMVPHPETTMSSMLDMARQIATLELQLSIERERTAQLQQVNGFLLERLALAHITTATNSHSHIVGNGRGVGPINIDRPNGHASGDDLVNERGSIMSAVPAGRSTKIRTVDITSQREDANQHSHGVMSRDKRAAAIPEYSGPPQEQEVPRTARQQHIGATVHRRSDSACRMNHNKQDTKDLQCSSSGYATSCVPDDPQADAMLPTKTIYRGRETGQRWHEFAADAAGKELPKVWDKGTTQPATQAKLISFDEGDKAEATMPLTSGDQTTQEYVAKPAPPIAPRSMLVSRHAKTANTPKDIAATRALLMYRPSTTEQDIYRSVLINGIPGSVSFSEVLSHVTGGIIVSATPSNTAFLTGSCTVLVTFLHEASARSFVSRTENHPISLFDGAKEANVTLTVTLLSTPTYPIPNNLRYAITEHKTTRLLYLHTLPPSIQSAALRTILSEQGTNFSGIVNINRTGLGTVIVEFSGVAHAIRAVERVKWHSWLRGVKIEYGPDPCDFRTHFEDDEVEDQDAEEKRLDLDRQVDGQAVIGAVNTPQAEVHDTEDGMQEMGVQELQPGPAQDMARETHETEALSPTAQEYVPKATAQDTIIGDLIDFEESKAETKPVGQAIEVC